MASEKTRSMVLIAMMAAVICVLGPLSLNIPISPVPISMANLGICFAVYVLGMKKGTAACLLYLLIGFVGVPVFASFTAGAGKLFGPTGGYMIGYVFLALISGFFIDRWPHNYILHFAGLVLGTLVLYIFGTAWLAYQASMTFQAALAAGVIPFIPGDVCKIILAVPVGSQVKKRLIRAGILTE